MQIRLQQLNPTVGNLINNKKRIIDAINSAEKDGIDLIIFSELSTCGYPPMDLLERQVFRKSIYGVNDDIIKATKNTAVVFGSIAENESGKGRKCYNSAIVAQHGKEIATVHKTLLPTYDVFDELRYFEPAKELEPVEINGFPFGVTVCEDIWYNNSEVQYHVYEKHPAEELVKKGAKAIINISASPFTKKTPVGRKEMLANHSKEYKQPLFYVNQVGAQTELVFDGDSLAIGVDGVVKARANRFTEDVVDVTLDEESLEVSSSSPKKNITDEPSKEQVIFEGLTLGIKDYLAKTKAAEKVILGLSGGIDSALVCAIAVEALGAENVIGVTMPSEFSSAGSVTDSQKLADNLGIELMEIPIKNIYDNFLESLQPVFKGTAFNVAEENLQSRSRGVLLMAIANKFGYLLLNTGNKSELAVGYCTLYGDMAGALSVLADVYKTEVFTISKWLNESYYKKEVIPESTIQKPPSAELRPDQKDSDSLPDYEVLDAILKYYLEEQLSRNEIIAKGIEPETVDKTIRLVDLSEFKRKQAPPGLKVTVKAFGTGRRWPLAQQWTGLEKEMPIPEKN